MSPTLSPVLPEDLPSPRLDRAAIEGIVASGRRLLVQGGMGIHASDGVSGLVAAHRGARLVGVGTISAVLKTPEMLRTEIRRARRDARGGYVGVNLMAAINKADFETLARVSIEEKVSFIVQGAGISREILRMCREGGVPFAGIVSSGRLAAMYEKWGADFIVAEGAEAGGHIGDIGHPLPALTVEVLGATSLPVVAAGGVDAADVARFIAGGAAGVQIATRFLACSDGDVHGAFKEMHLGKTVEDVTIITSCVKGMKARAVRNAFTDKLARGEAVPAALEALVLRQGGVPGAPEVLHRVPRREPVPVPRERVQGELLHHGRPPRGRRPRRHRERPLLHRHEPRPDRREDARGAPDRGTDPRGARGEARGGRARDGAARGRVRGSRLATAAPGQRP